MTTLDPATCELPEPEPASAFLRRCEQELRPFNSKFGALRMGSLNAPGPRHEWLIEGVLSMGDKSVIAGVSQSGKSFAAIHKALCVASGRPHFGMAVKQGLVVYIASEGARGVRKRLQAWKQHYGAELGVTFDDDLPFVLLTTPVRLFGQHDGADGAALIEEIRQICLLYPDHHLRMVVFDTLAACSVGADENSVKDMGMVMSVFAQINDELKAQTVAVHHLNAAGSLRGSTCIYAGVDQTINISRDPVTNVRTAAVGKQRDDDASVRWSFELASVHLLDEVTGRPMYDGGRPVTSCVCVEVGEKEKLRKSELAKGYVPRPSESEFLRSFFSAAKRFGRAVPTTWDLGPRVPCIVDWEQVKLVFADRPDLSIAEPKEGETQGEAEKRKWEADRKRRQRLETTLKPVVDNLRKWGIIGFDRLGEGKDREWYCWWTGAQIRGFPETAPVEKISQGGGQFPPSDDMVFSEEF